MTKREEFVCELPTTDGNFESIKIVYFTKQVVCRVCGGDKYIRDEIDNIEKLCESCHGFGKKEDVDYSSMTPDEIEIYKKFEKNTSNKKEGMNNLKDVFNSYKDDPYNDDSSE